MYPADHLRRLAAVRSEREAMFAIRPAWIERDGKRPHAVVTIDEWRQVEELLEDLEDIRDAGRILSDSHDELIPEELAHRIL